MSTIYLVRHGVAVDIDEWAQLKHPDTARPLSEVGYKQSIALADMLLKDAKDTDKIKHLCATNFIRTSQTLQPLADQLEEKIDIYPQLGQNKKLKEAWPIFEELLKNGKSTVICSHGDTIDNILTELVTKHNINLQPAKFIYPDKTSAWVLDVKKDQVVAGRYLPPPKY